MIPILASPTAICKNNAPYQEIVDVLKRLKSVGNPVAIVSNHDKPSWFDTSFPPETGVQFLQVFGRQSGEIVSTNTAYFNLQPYDMIVLGANNEDMQMGKNGNAILVAAGWSANNVVRNLGISVEDAAQFENVVCATAKWSKQWWFSANHERYQVHVLSDLSSYYASNEQQRFSAQLTDTIKHGGVKLNIILTILARSILSTGINNSTENLVWGVYPSSNSCNDDTDTLSDFTHRLRTTVSRVRYCKRGEPLFIRHTPSPKRSLGQGGDRTDPTSQITTMHLNPYYKSNKLTGKHVIVVDDCTTYGLSFGVVAAFLQKAGVAKITCIALGKFGNQMKYYDISILSDPFAPVTSSEFEVKSKNNFGGQSSNSTQQTILTIF